MWDGVVAMVPCLIAAFFYAQYGITRTSYETTRAQIVPGGGGPGRHARGRGVADGVGPRQAAQCAGLTPARARKPSTRSS